VAALEPLSSRSSRSLSRSSQPSQDASCGNQAPFADAGESGDGGPTFKCGGEIFGQCVHPVWCNKGTQYCFITEGPQPYENGASCSALPPGCVSDDCEACRGPQCFDAGTGGPSVLQIE
jgi:hypothetical protein